MATFATKALAEVYLEQKDFCRKTGFGDVWRRGRDHRVVKPPRHFGDVWRVYAWTE